MRNKCFVRIANTDSLGYLRPLKAIAFELVIKAYIKQSSPLLDGR